MKKNSINNKVIKDASKLVGKVKKEGLPRKDTFLSYALKNKRRRGLIFLLGVAAGVGVSSFISAQRRKPGKVAELVVNCHHPVDYYQGSYEDSGDVSPYSKTDDLAADIAFAPFKEAITRRIKDSDTISQRFQDIIIPTAEELLREGRGTRIEIISLEDDDVLDSFKDGDQERGETNKLEVTVGGKTRVLDIDSLAELVQHLGEKLDLDKIKSLVGGITNPDETDNIVKTAREALKDFPSDELHKKTIKTVREVLKDFPIAEINRGLAKHMREALKDFPSYELGLSNTEAESMSEALKYFPNDEPEDSE